MFTVCIINGFVLCHEDSESKSLRRPCKASKFLLLYAVLYFLFLYAPIFLLPIFAFNDSAIISFPLSGVTLDWFLLLWETEALHDALYNSVTIALIAAALSTILGIFAARAATRYNFPGKKGITGFLLLPIVLPEIIVGVALLVVMVQLGLSLSAWTVVIGHVLIYPLCHRNPLISI